MLLYKGLDKGQGQETSGEDSGGSPGSVLKILDTNLGMAWTQQSLDISFC